jgi:hypothetical protein
LCLGQLGVLFVAFPRNLIFDWNFQSIVIDVTGVEQEKDLPSEEGKFNL